MSTWSHVAGTVRLDDLSFIAKPLRNTVSEIEEIIGPMCTFEEWNDESTIPRGSEGGIEYKVCQNDDGSLCRFNIAFWGDLRDFDTEDCESIVTWFRDLCECKFGNITESLVSVRDAVLKYYTEFEDVQHVLYWDQDKNLIRKVDI